MNIKDIKKILLPQINAFSFTDNIITRDQLKNLIELIPTSGKESKRKLTQILNTFCQQCNENVLNAEEKQCLNLITEDYKRGLFGSRNSITNLVLQKLNQSETLSSFRTKLSERQEFDDDPENFLAYLQTFLDRVNQLALNISESYTMQNVMLPGLKKLITAEEEIVEHAVTNFGQLYYLDHNYALPLHTDHTPIADGPAYRKTLRRLIVNFFGAAELAHNAGRLKEFCGKISHAYCFEGRVTEAFAWASSLTEIVSFNDLMAHHIEGYLAYAHVMLKQTDEQACFLEPACEFIMKRYSNMPCAIDINYAPNGKVTRANVNAYLKDILNYNSKQPIIEIELLIASLEKESKGFRNAPFWNHGIKNLKQIKIQALTELKLTWEAALANNEAPLRDAILVIKDKYPDAIRGKWSQRTKILLDKAEQASATVDNDVNSSRPQ